MSKSQTATGQPLPVADLVKLVGASFGPALRLLLQRSTFDQLPRLLHEGIDPVVHLLLQANNTAIINQWLNKGTKVAFISSFPRSGNTWMRFLLSDVLLQKHNVKTTTNLPVDPNDLIPYLNGNSIVRRLSRCPDWAAKPSTTFVKTHVLFQQLEQVFPGNWRQDSEGRCSRATFRNCKVVYIYRSPEDALVSLYHLNCPDIYARNRARLGIDAFCRMEVSGWVKNISSYLRAADDGFPVFFVSYERMLEKPAIVLGDLLHWLDFEHDSRMLHRAVANMQFCKLQAMEMEQNKTRSPGTERKLFFRRGATGSGQAQLQESTLREISQQTDSLSREADLRLPKQSSAHPEPAIVVGSPPEAKASIQNGKAIRNEENREPKISRWH